MVGPFDGLDEHRRPWIDQEAIRIVRVRRGISEPEEPAAPPAVMPKTFESGSPKGVGPKIKGTIMDR
jgi:hypothetical protein